MGVFIILGVSILFQLAAAGLALKLIPVTGHRKAWVLISAAIFLMAVRRCVALYLLAAGVHSQHPGLASELIAMTTSGLMFAGVAGIKPLFRSIERSTKALMASEEKYRGLFEDSHDAIFVSSREGRFLEVNRSMCDLFGYTREEMLEMDVHGIYLHPEDRQKFQQEIELRGFVKDYPVKFRKKDGTVMDCILSSTAQRGPDGAIVEYRGINRDVTELNRAMDMLDAERKRFFSLLNELPGFVDLHAPDHSIPFANRYFRETFGDPEGRRCYEVFFDRSAPCVECPTHRVFRTKKAQSFERRHANGSTYQIHQYPYVTPEGTLQVLELGIDISNRKLAENRLRESEAKFRLLAETIPAAILICQEGSVRFVNPAAEAISGYSKSELLSMDCWTLLHPDFVEGFRDRVLKNSEGAGPGLIRPFKILAGGGVDKWVNVASVSINFEGQEALLLVAFDVTEHKRIEEALRESEVRYRDLVQNANSIILRLDTEGRVTFFNEFAQDFFGYREDEVLGRVAIGTLIPGDGLPGENPGGGGTDALKHLQHYLANERQCIRRDGERVWVSWTHKVMLDGDGKVTGILGIGNDVTELKLLEEQYRQSQRMEAVGQLAGGIAHDFNNLLGVITGYSELALVSLGQHDPVRERVEHIKRAGEKAASLTRQLLAFSRKQILDPKVLNLNSAIAEMEKMLRRLIGEDIEFVTVLDPELVPVKVDLGQIEQVIMNLVVNARDAMPDGGKLILETANVELDESYARQHVSVEPGAYVMLAVSDTGAGIDKDTLPHIFEPFFTTKDASKGTGLGLATVYGIIKQSGGNIWVYSVPGQGTTFKIYFPQVHEAPEAVRRPRAEGSSPRGSETVLVVEDDEMFQAMISQAIGRMGYAVLEAGSGEEALRIAREHQGGIHLMVTDVVMPGMSGRQLAERLASLRPETLVLFMSGYTTNAIVHHGVLDRGTAFVQKPFAPEVLLTKIREMLDQAAAT